MRMQHKRLDPGIRQRASDPLVARTFTPSAATLSTPARAACSMASVMEDGSIQWPVVSG